MEYEKVVRLLRALSDKTGEGKIKWIERTSNCYEATVGKATVSIAEYYDSDIDPDFEEPDYTLAFSKGYGSEWIDSFSDSELREVMSDSFATMRSLYKNAKRSAKGVSKLIDDMLDELDDDIPF
ncbi:MULTISPECIES: hypothetical protein [unclassified Acidovorax]|uniref:hypothetical protein n=1 Tax=unclassified Acidovorax TaxID=2684926 RepID=UPI00288342AC|nr:MULTISPECIES: hypothetical protein [unclassified Acidovorax]